MAGMMGGLHSIDVPTSYLAAHEFDGQCASWPLDVLGSRAR